MLGDVFKIQLDGDGDDDCDGDCPDCVAEDLDENDEELPFPGGSFG